MLARALLAFIALPGIVALAAPLLVAFWSDATFELNVWGAILLTVGVFGLLWCVRDFYVRGKGTLAPWSPPRRLVTGGLYRFTRNPMYVAVLIVLAAWAVLFNSRDIALYAGVVAIGFHLRVVFGEEPWLERTHGGQWHEYRQTAPRWLGPWRRGRRE
jgi:protein-S-isoprenylcysteine O-methyltransferase Ste14